MQRTGNLPAKTLAARTILANESFIVDKKYGSDGTRLVVKVVCSWRWGIGSFGLLRGKSEPIVLCSAEGDVARTDVEAEERSSSGSKPDRATSLKMMLRNVHLCVLWFEVYLCTLVGLARYLSTVMCCHVRLAGLIENDVEECSFTKETV